MLYFLAAIITMIPVSLFTYTALRFADLGKGTRWYIPICIVGLAFVLWISYSGLVALELLEPLLAPEAG